MSRSVYYVAAALLALGSSLNAAVFHFDTDPFAGSTALTTPGRQVVGGEPSITFSIPSDIFSFDPGVFNLGPNVSFANNLAGALPTSGLNIIALRSFDDDSNPATPFGAGNAANLIAARVTTPGPGFFIYFNQGLDLPRLVYSTNLDDNTADLKIMARMINLNGAAGRTAFEGFASSNFTIVPEPSSFVLITAGAALCACTRLFRRRRARSMNA